MRDTSWQKSAKWYTKIVGNKGHYYHQQVVLPAVKNALHILPHAKILDIGCGQGVFARTLPSSTSYIGIDLAKNLIQEAKKLDKSADHTYFVADATKSLPLSETDFTHAVAILSLQNMQNPQLTIKNISRHLQKGGIFVFVLNHPAFRIPRQSGWEVGENKQQYRYVNRYMSHLKIPISMHPGQQQSEVTWSFHFPISFFVKALKDNGFVIEDMEELTSDKESVGKTARMENRARAEIPLFLLIVARKA